MVTLKQAWNYMNEFYKDYVNQKNKGESGIGALQLSKDWYWYYKNNGGKKFPEIEITKAFYELEEMRGKKS